MKLNVYVAKSGHCSRRKAGILIRDGAVKVNGSVIREPWYNIIDGDKVVIGGKPLSVEKYVYIVFNKPYGVTSTVEDKFASRKIVDLVPKGMGRVYPVGRLDRMSRGLIILTNDGEFCQKLTHPKFEIEKEYRVTLRGPVADDLPGKLIKGVEEGGDFLSVRSASIGTTSEKRSVVKVIVCEGKKRHIRRLFSKLGFNVMDLQRVRVGDLCLGGLREGSFRTMEKEDIYLKALGAGKKEADLPAANSRERSIKNGRQKDTRSR